MINKISKIKNLGIFSDYQWNSALPNFKKYNLIYGWNGSGKTTLTRLFDILRTGENTEFNDVEYTLDCSVGNISNGMESNLKIRVFNADYINANVQLQDCKAKPIFILGEENKTLLDQIENNVKSLESKKSQLQTLTQEKDVVEKQYNSKFTDIARTISANASGEATRKYDRRDAIEAYKVLTTKKELDEEEIVTNQTTLKQLEKPTIDDLSLTLTENTQKEGEKPQKIMVNQSLVDEYYSEMEKYLGVEILSKAIDKLRKNKDISEWVETGLKLHLKHNISTCEFCMNEISEKRLKELNAHFNDEDKILKDNINKLVSKVIYLIDTLNKFQVLDKANLYEELQSSYQLQKETLKSIITDLCNNLEDAVSILEDKKHKVNIRVDTPPKPNLDKVCTILSDINDIIKRHNDKTSNFVKEKKTAEAVLETHYLSTIKDDVTKIEQSDKNKTEDIKKLETEITSLKRTIIDNKSKITSPDKACAQLNKNIHQFLGRADINFEVEDEGYLIKRGNVIAKHLSEGEKTAIAFAYFIVHLKDQDFNINDGIVVIDDPVSSLDSNSIFQAFSFLKNSVKDAKQVFIFTHNFDFLRLLLNWLNYRALQPSRELYMVNNKDIENKREAFIDKMDKDLQEHESEYHYLFKKLYNFNSDGTIESVYPIPNIARKVLDTFLMFRVPNNDSNYTKLESLRDQFDEIKLTSLYKFTNDNSHITGKGFDPSLIPECTKNVGYLMDLINETFPEHYKILVASISS